MNIIALLFWLVGGVTVSVRNDTLDRQTVYADCGVPRRLGEIEMKDTKTFSVGYCPNLRIRTKAVSSERLLVQDGDSVSVTIGFGGMYVTAVK